MPASRFTITLLPELVEQIDDRGDERSGAIATSLQRYLALIEYHRRELAQLFTEAERGLILDALNGILFADTFAIQYVSNEIEQASSELAEKWHVDAPILIEKLNSLTYGAKLALVDAVERWWRSKATQTSDLFKAPERRLP